MGLLGVPLLGQLDLVLSSGLQIRWRDGLADGGVGREHFQRAQS